MTAFCFFLAVFLFFFFYRREKKPCRSHGVTFLKAIWGYAHASGTSGKAGTDTPTEKPACKHCSMLSTPSVLQHFLPQVPQLMFPAQVAAAGGASAAPGVKPSKATLQTLLLPVIWEGSRRRKGGGGIEAPLGGRKLC